MLYFLDRGGKQIPHDRWIALIRRPGSMTLSKRSTRTLEVEAFSVGLITDMEQRCGTCKPYGVRSTPLFKDDKGCTARGSAAYAWYATAAEALDAAEDAAERGGLVESK